MKGSEYRAEPDPLDRDVAELARLMPRFLRLAKGPADMLPPALRRHFERAGLGMRHLPVLVAVALYGPWSVRQIADHVALTPSTTSQLVGELERAGLLERGTDPADRRRALITLSLRHHDAVQAVAVQRRDLVRGVLGGLTDEERAHFLKGWRLLIEAGEAQLAAEGRDDAR